MEYFRLGGLYLSETATCAGLTITITDISKVGSLAVGPQLQQLLSEVLERGSIHKVPSKMIFAKDVVIA